MWPRQPPIGLRLVGGDETSAGGSWQLTLPPQSEFGSGSLGLSEYFRARWNNALSAPVLARGPLTPFLRSSAIRRGRGFVRIYVDTHATGQKMAGKFVELQRKSTVTGAWVLASRARLKRVHGGYLTTLSNSLRPRGVSYRVYIPVKTARPCYDPGWTVSWTTRSAVCPARRVWRLDWRNGREPSRRREDDSQRGQEGEQARREEVVIVQEELPERAAFTPITLARAFEAPYEPHHRVYASDEAGWLV